MTYHSINSSDDVQFLLDFQSGTDDPIYWSSPNKYERSIVRGAKADIVVYSDLWYKNHAKDYWYLVDHTRDVRWKAYSLEYSGQMDRVWMDSIGLSSAEAVNILNMRLIKRIQGNSVDPTLFIKELDRNFTTFSTRANQAARFLSNLRNPKELARLTLRYFKGSETRRSLTKRYSSAKRAFMKRTPRWKTRDWSSSYLEYQFGWRPMCNDVWNLVGLARETKIKAAQQFAKVGLTPQESSGFRSNAGPVGRASDTAYCKTLTAGHAKITFEITHPWLRSGASLESPSYAAWDSIPYSWLLDCVTNVGQHLKYIMYDMGLTLRTGYCSVLRTVDGSVSIDTKAEHLGDGINWAQDRGYDISGELSYTKIHCQRHIYTSFPSVPWFNKVLNTLSNCELLSVIAAFLHQLFAGFADRSRPWKLSPPSIK